MAIINPQAGAVNHVNIRQFTCSWWKSWPQTGHKPAKMFTQNGSHGKMCPFYQSVRDLRAVMMTYEVISYSCLQYTVKRVDGKLRQLDRMTQYSSIRGMEHFFDMQIELIWRFPTINTKYFDVQRNYPTVFRCQATEFSDNFPSTFRRMNQNQKLHHRGDRSSDL